MALERSFNVGEFGITEDCIVFGNGGGFVQEYNDLTIYPDGRVSKVVFTLPAPVDDYEQSLLGVIETFHYENILQVLEKISFFDTASDESSTWSKYIVTARPGKGLHAVEWNAENSAHPANTQVGTLSLFVRGLEALLVSGEIS